MLAHQQVSVLPSPAMLAHVIPSSNFVQVDMQQLQQALRLT